MDTTEKTAAVALCKAVRAILNHADPCVGEPSQRLHALSLASDALERAINAAELPQPVGVLANDDEAAPYDVGEGWRELEVGETVGHGDEYCYETEAVAPLQSKSAYWVEADEDEESGYCHIGLVLLVEKSLRVRRRVETPAQFSQETAPGLVTPEVVAADDRNAAIAGKLPDEAEEPLSIHGQYLGGKEVRP